MADVLKSKNLKPFKRRTGCGDCGKTGQPDMMTHRCRSPVRNHSLDGSQKYELSRLGREDLVDSGPATFRLVKVNVMA